MKEKLFFIIFFFLNVIIACQKEIVVPLADFEVGDYNLYKYQYFVGSSIYFSNKSKYAENYMWNFGDNSISTDENPEHIYKTHGLFKVELIAKNNQSEDKKIIDIEVLPERFVLLTSVKKWKLVGKKQYGEKVDLTSCDKSIRLSFTTNYEYIMESIDNSNCISSYKEKWYIGNENIIYESTGIGSWFGHDFYLTDKILILKMPHNYEFVLEPE